MVFNAEHDAPAMRFSESGGRAMQRDRDDERRFAGRPLAVDSRWTQAGSARSDELAAARSEEAAARIRIDWCPTPPAPPACR